MPRNDTSWKSNIPHYQGIHARVRKLWGKADHCENEYCSSKSKVYEWANMSGEYIEERYDWKQMCHSCHFKYDYSIGQRDKSKVVSREKGKGNSYAPRKPVSQLSQNGELIMTYVSIAEAARAMELNVTQIWRCINGKASLEIGRGFIWRYL